MLAGLPFPELHPALVTIPEIGGFGPFPLRWYALAYIAGILIGWRYAVAIARRGRLFGGTSPVTTEDVDDLVFWATIGIIAGGRLGYIFFYQIPFEFDRVAENPLMILRVWEGGMSFHGGLIGVALAMVFLARSRKVPLLSLADLAACAAPIGIFFGRVANFINAELYGRVTDWQYGVVFPQGSCRDAVDPATCQTGAPGSFNWTTGEWLYSGAEQPRHASQLYEAVLEGLLLFVVLAVLVWGFRILRRPGLVTGLFLIGYGIGRSIAEQFREPDAHIEFLAGDWLTMGMLLSLPMWIGGAALLVWSLRRRDPQVA